jgi:hypothetical protein
MKADTGTSNQNENVIRRIVSLYIECGNTCDFESVRRCETGTSTMKLETHYRRLGPATPKHRDLQRTHAILHPISWIPLLYAKFCNLKIIMDCATENCIWCTHHHHHVHEGLGVFPVP